MGRDRPQSGQGGGVLTEPHPSRRSAPSHSPHEGEGEGASRLLSIQYLRAFAALMVVAYHACRWSKPGFDIGAAGVDVFFVISGFILWTVAAERPVTAQTFLARRWARVAPTYWVLTLVVAGVALVWPDLIWDAKPTLSHVLMSLAFIPHINEVGLPFPIITSGWSLNYEAIFYVVFTLSLLAPPKRRFLAITLGLLAVPIFGIVVRPAYFLGANLMFLQFLAGVWLAHWRLHADLLSRRKGLICCALGLVGFIALSPLNLFEHLWRPLLWGAPALLLVTGAVSVEGDGGLPDIKALRFLGDASYSIYLAHLPAIQVLSHVLDANRPAFVPAAIAVSLACGVACYFGLERPLTRLLSRRKLGFLPSSPT